jgi:hypothetical protein
MQRQQSQPSKPHPARSRSTVPRPAHPQKRRTILFLDGNRAEHYAHRNYLSQAWLRRCLQHLYGNHKKALARAGIVGEDLKRFKTCFYKLAFATNMDDFNKILNEFASTLEKTKRNVFIERINSVEIDHWSYANLPDDVCTWGRSTSQGAESVMNRLVDARKLPPAVIFLAVHRMVIKDFKERRDFVRKTDKNGATTAAQLRANDILPQYGASLKVFEFDQKEMTGKVEEVGSALTRIVSLNNRKCTCREWEMKGIPCCHAQAIIQFHKISLGKHIAHISSNLTISADEIIDEEYTYKAQRAIYNIDAPTVEWTTNWREDITLELPSFKKQKAKQKPIPGDAAAAKSNDFL